MKMMIAITSSCLFASACASQPLGGGDAADGGGTAPTGIYSLRETRTSDCWPPAANASDVATASVIAAGSSTVNLWFSDPSFLTPPGSEPPRPSWGGSDVVDGSATSDTIRCGVSQRRVITIEGQSAELLTARIVDTFSDVAKLTQPCEPGALPARDCSVTTELRYELAQPCAAACLRFVEPSGAKGGPGTFECGC
ncbi:MAG TPA: hypothetical protein VF997_05315 [Polyangia bacterium]